jgi:hypothetical protein
MAGGLLTPRWRAVDNNGAPISGAKIYFFQAGTTTPVTTYSEKALSSAQANPLVADGNGFFASSFADDTASYKVRYTDASDNQFWEDDNVDTYQLGGSSLATRFLQAASNPLDYGAVGDGVADESTEVQSAITGATRVVDLLGKTYRCDSTLNLKSGITFKNGTLDFTNCTDNEYIKGAGSLGSATALTADPSAGDTTLTMGSTSGYAVGDIVFVSDSTAIPNGGTQGEMSVVVATTATTLDLANPLILGYTTAASSQVQESTPISDVVLKNISVSCNSGASGSGRAIYFEHGHRIRVDNCDIESPKGTGIEFRGCLDAQSTNCRIFGGVSATVGVEIAEHSRRVKISNLLVQDLGIGARVGVASVGSTSGLCLDVKFSGCEFETTESSNGDFVMYLDDLAQDIVVDGCKFMPPPNAGSGISAGGIKVDGVNLLVKNCEFRDCHVGVAIDDTGSTSHLTARHYAVRSNVFYGAYNACFQSSSESSASYLTNFDFSMNQCIDCNVDGSNPQVVRVYRSEFANISGNTFHTSASGSPRAIQATSVECLSVSSNVFYGTWSYCMLLGDLSCGSVSGNCGVVTSNSTYAINVSSTSSNLAISGNAFDVTGTTTSGKFLDTSGTTITRMSVVGNVGDCSGSPAIDLDGNVDYCVVAGNTMLSTNTTNETITMGNFTNDGLNISGNILITGGNAYNANINASNTNTIFHANVALGAGTGALTGAADVNTDNVT